ncbi:hypothetical protein MJO28_009807 [Puccinia striiformis f. sp. tritici]|uniref:Uncharacterized protein n=1 Tax=Puccinia striiformis f. sp. tritici TaxID=168172 RepID=A0ACC0EA61_9BASI|nr:hypothetical protein MJO28_009807 [Puccinia striiformis f. sp. tritici]KAI7950899.1 hypothetical protein MJO29_009573 [Puccinia striiformis f. sp. tritici]KAI9615381.1 hypothetical protein KEM48_005672 [Puccinia striiformis f. sp. tritici PST-130]
MHFSRSMIVFLTAASGLANATGWYDCKDPSYSMSLCSTTNKGTSPANSRVWMRKVKPGTQNTYWCGPKELKHCCPASLVYVAREHSEDFSDSNFSLMCQQIK